MIRICVALLYAFCLGLAGIGWPHCVYIVLHGFGEVSDGLAGTDPLTVVLNWFGGSRCASDAVCLCTEFVGWTRLVPLGMVSAGPVAPVAVCVHFHSFSVLCHGTTPYSN